MPKTGAAWAAIVGLLAGGPALAASGGGHGSSSGGDSGHTGSSAESAFVSPIGEPGKRSEIDRRILILAKDGSFAPDELEVHAGETVKFVVSNVGSQRHSFVLGTPSAQLRASTELDGLPADPSLNADQPNRMLLSPGETGVLVWKFRDQLPAKARSQPIFGCHIADHFRRGMRGEIVMQAPKTAQGGDSGGH